MKIDENIDWYFVIHFGDEYCRCDNVGVDSDVGDKDVTGNGEVV